MPPEPALAEELALLTRAAEAGGAAALGYFRKGVRQWEKPDGAGPVSDADLAANTAVREVISAARPDYGWLSEEDPDTPDRLARERVVVVDPIDGTRAFLDGQPGFSVSVALVADGQAVAGIVHLPARCETYAATAGGGATLNGRPLETSSQATIAGANVLATTAQMKPEHWPGGVPEFERHFRSSLAWRLCLVASARFDGLVTIRDTHEWDIAAGMLIATEAGATVTDRDGRSIPLNQPEPRVPGLIAAPPALHADLIARRASSPA